MLKGQIKERSERTVWAEYKDGFEVEIRYTPRGRLRRLVEEAHRQKWDPVTHQRTSELDREKFYNLIAQEIVVNWRGLTPEVLKKLVEMDCYPAEEVPYTKEDCAEILAHAYDFDLWVQDLSASLDHFEAARRAAEEKNSSPSPAKHSN